MCFSVIAGKNTTVDNTCLLGVNNDWTGYPGMINFVESKNYQPGAMHTLVSGDQIPNVETTCSYIHTSTAYDTGILKNNSWWGGVNENKVAVGMQGVYSFLDSVEQAGITLQADDIPILLLQRAKSAREGVEMIGKLLDEHNFGVSSIEGGEGVNNISIVDPEEGFFLEIVPGGHWVAKRVKDDEVEVRPNCYGIQNVNFDDGHEFLYSENIKQKAIDEGLYTEGEAFNFSKIFSEDSSVSEYYGTADAPENALRKWHSLNFMGGEDIDLAEMRYATKPDRKLTPRDIMDLLTLSSEDTKYALDQTKEAGPAGNPFWMEVSTGVGQAGSVVSSVFQLRKDMPSDVGIVAWFGMANAHISPFIPHYFGSKGMPASYKHAELANYNPNSAWWIYQEVGQLCYRDYETIAKEIVIPEFRAMEDHLLKNQDALDDLFLKMYREDAENANKFIEQFTHSQASLGLEKSRELTQYIKSRFLANTYINF